MLIPNKIAPESSCGLVPKINITILETTYMIGLYKIRTHITPVTLNTVWANAALFADVLATVAAMFAVIVVPIFSPSTIAAAISNGSQP
ncbi:hypothetical protein SDC9_207937 [bioreactor metagenome]|uniref:Uncharacterized protein n=1 Tax=bioreactor metagenome TaxID=1076179 RepID=A0A645JAR5_9ZZZZ